MLSRQRFVAIVHVLAFSVLIAAADAVAPGPPPAPAAPAPGVVRQTLDLTGIWEIVPDVAGKGIEERWFEPGTAGAWKPIAVPASWETVLGITFDTVAWYRKRFQVPAFAPGQHLLLRFHAAATEARVWVNGVEVGRHLGPWTPFTCDLTDAVKPGATATVAVRLDEKVGHNTQGFLPIVAPHFGGIWQRVEAFVVGAGWLDDTRIAIDASKVDLATKKGALAVSVPVLGAPPADAKARFSLRSWNGTIVATGTAPIAAAGADAGANASWRWEGAVEPWDIGAANLYALEVALLGPGDELLDAVGTRFGFRAVEARGDQVFLNGRPIVVRGFLTWGLYPPLLAPAPDLARFHAQLLYFRACGFNCIKFCLWVPPRELLDVVDEEGMLAWIEYPTWHPKLDQAHRDELLREYGEMSFHDARHPSAVLRSITCETGPSADLGVLRDIYDLLKARCPGTLVEDDSSWIGWNRIHDFWDDHPYGNNRTWREVLRNLADHVRKNGVKPLLLGEAIAADTWTDSKRFLDHSVDARPWWAPNWFESLLTFERDLEGRFGMPGFSPVDDLKRTARKYAMDMRRWQIETYREAMPHAGYVVSVVRDNRLCNMGLLDDFERPKWSPADWQWHGMVMAPLVTPADRRAFRCDAGGAIALKPCIRLSADREDLGAGEVRWEGTGAAAVSIAWGQGAAAEERPLSIDGEATTLPIALTAERPTRVILNQNIRGKDGSQRWSAYEFWALPKPASVPEGMMIYGDQAGIDLAAIFPGARLLEAGQPVPETASAVVTRTLTKQVIEYLEAGGAVFHITSDLAGSLREDGIWFLRGVAWAPPEPAAFFDQVPRECLSYLQLFELGGGGVIRGEKLWEQVDPLLSFLETHDLDRVRPNLMLFVTGVGKGRLAASCLRHGGGEKDNYAGLWLARAIVAYLREGPAPARSLDPELILALKTGLEAEVRHVEGPWRFSKDTADAAGVEGGWFKPDFDDATWTELTPRSKEEGEIWSAYDGWGWYRKRVAIPAAWNGGRARLVLNSVDDLYELYVNGKKAGAYGKMDRSESSFLKKTSVDITDFVKPGEENLLVLRVYDWVGSGGLNGAVWLTTGPVEEGLDILKR